MSGVRRPLASPPLGGCGVDRHPVATFGRASMIRTLCSGGQVAAVGASFSAAC